MPVEAKSNFLRNWLATVSNPKSNVLQILQDKFQSKFDECFSDVQNQDSYLYPWNNFKETHTTCDENLSDGRSDTMLDETQTHYQNDDGKLFIGKVIDGKRSGRGILSWKDCLTSIEVQVEGFYHQGLLVGNVARISKGSEYRCIVVPKQVFN